MLFILIFLLEMVLQSCRAQCDNYFPKIIGGKFNNTYIIDFDADDNTIYMCGSTQDYSLAGYSLLSDICDDYCIFPLIAASDINSYLMKWGFTDQS